MSYIVIDTDGTLHVRDQRPTSQTIRAEVGDWDMVRLMPFVRGWVNDTGLIDGQSQRNVVGAVMLMCCDGPQQPYAGSIVITGWHEYREIVPLEPEMLQALRELHDCVTKALANDDSCPTCAPSWRDMVRSAAEMVRDAPTPEIQIISLDLDGGR